jgi:multiple sugar transport system substrate-binding protein
MQHTPNRTVGAIALVLAAAVGVPACASGSGDSGSSSEGGVTTLELWTHNGGNATELAVNKKVVDNFNASQSKYKVKLQSFPQAAYNDAVTAAASAKKLPCIMDIDGPNVPNWAWAGYLQPLDLPAGFFDKQLPSTLGKIDDKIYSFGHYDVAMNLTARKSVLTQYGIRIPTVDKPWTGAEFDAAIAKIKAGGRMRSYEVTRRPSTTRPRGPVPSYGDPTSGTCSTQERVARFRRSGWRRPMI